MFIWKEKGKTSDLKGKTSDKMSKISIQQMGQHLIYFISSSFRSFIYFNIFSTFIDNLSGSTTKDTPEIR